MTPTTRLAALCRALVFVGAWLAGCEPDDPCTTGERSCPCTPLRECDDGLVCSVNTCVAPHHTTLRVNAPGARACELVIQEGATVIAEATFEEGARGSSARRGNRMSLAFISTADVDVDGNDVKILWLGNQSRPDVTISESECFDRLGQPIAGAGVEIR